MNELKLDVRMEGFDLPIGCLARDSRNALAFAYDPEYANRADAVPLSLSLPLDGTAFEDVPTRSFFENLLQERDSALREIRAKYSLSRDDLAGLLYYLGKDCAGAVSVLPQGTAPVKAPGDLLHDYRIYSRNELADIVVALHNRAELPQALADPSPLAGVQSKIAVTILPGGLFAEPIPGSGAPTTHILKVPDRNRPQDARLELAALQLSTAIGFPTAKANVVNIAGVDALLVARFDRRIASGRVFRIHQEDFAQALGLPPELKYERQGRPGFRFDSRAIALNLNATIDPASSRIRFIRQAVFDLAIGNVDAHAKNHAILHLDRDRIELAPRYDLMPTRLDPNVTDELSFKIGNASRLEDVDAKEFDQFLEILGINNPAAQKRVRVSAAKEIGETLASYLPELDRSFKRFANLIGTNLRQLLPALGVSVPAAADAQDTFVEKGGGWLMGS